MWVATVGESTETIQSASEQGTSAGAYHCCSMAMALQCLDSAGLPFQCNGGALRIPQPPFTPIAPYSSCGAMELTSFWLEGLLQHVCPHHIRVGALKTWGHVPLENKCGVPVKMIGGGGGG